MKTIKLQITVSPNGGTFTLKTIGTNWGAINVASLAIKIYGEDKSTPKYNIPLVGTALLAIKDDADGLQAASESLIPSYLTVDGFYLIAIEGLDVDTSVINSNIVCTGLNNYIEAKFRNKSIDCAFSQMYNFNNKNFNDVLLSITNVNGHFLLERLVKLSTLADYNSDREISWRKINKVLYTYYGN